jgi:Flp pilus assembly protein TadD
VIDGTLQMAVEEVRVSADAATRKLLWSGRWARPKAELLQVQDDVLAGIGGSLGGALSGTIAKAGLVQARRKPTGSLDAYDHFLLGNDAKHRWTPEGFDQAIWHFRRAVEIDPEYAEAWALLSLTLIFQSETARAEADRRKLWDEANAAAERGYAPDPDDPDVLWRIARERASCGRFDSAQTALRRAVDLAPGNSDVLMVSAWVSP